MAMSLRRLAVVPTVAESSLPSYAVQRWLRLVGPEGMSPEIVRTLNGEVVKAFAVPAVRETLRRIGTTSAAGPAEELQQFVQQENRKWSAMVRTEKITVQ